MGEVIMQTINPNAFQTQSQVKISEIGMPIMKYKILAKNKIYIHKPIQKYHHSKDEVCLIKSNLIFPSHGHNIESMLWI